MTRRRISRRGHYLLTFGLVQAGLGFLALAGPTGADSPGRRLVLEILHPPAYATLSVVVAAVAFIGACYRPPRLETAAFTGLALIAAARAAVLLYAAAATGETSPLAQALVFLLLLRVHLLVSGWPDPAAVPLVGITAEQVATVVDQLRRYEEDGPP